MYYISSKNKDKWGITDTTDGVEEFYNLEDIIALTTKFNLDIDGFDYREKRCCIVKPVNDTVRLIKQGEIHLALSTLSIKNNVIGIRFRSKPTKGEMKFVSNQVINIRRRGINDFSYDLGYSKSYRSGLTFDDILFVMEQFYSWTVTDCKSTEF